MILADHKLLMVTKSDLLSVCAWNSIGFKDPLGVAIQVAD